MLCLLFLCINHDWFCRAGLQRLCFEKITVFPLPHIRATDVKSLLTSARTQLCPTLRSMRSASSASSGLENTPAWNQRPPNWRHRHQWPQTSRAWAAADPEWQGPRPAGLSIWRALDARSQNAWPRGRGDQPRSPLARSRRGLINQLPAGGHALLGASQLVIHNVRD